MSNQDKIQREILPIPDRPYTGLIKYDAKDPESKFPPIEPLRPPAGTPNVLIVLLDDAGFGSASAFGGPCHTPNFEKLAANGLRYNRFHTTALCSPTRQALLTGRNHHTVGMGAITELAASAPGYNSIRPNTCAPLAETLKLNGYSTAQFGKCHEIPVWETSPMGPFNAWPTGGGGFEYFYGFLGGETNQYYPALKPVLARQMEVYAGFLEHTDHHVGRLIDALEALEVLEDTLVYVIIGDNGASAEGTPNGTFNEYFSLNGASALESVEFMTSKIDEFGGPKSYNHYAVGWAHALDTPYQWTKQVASHWGGTRNGTIVHWPRGIKGKGEMRNQFHHVIDIATTVLEVAGLPEPTIVNSVQQKPLEGVSMAYSFDDAAGAERHETQYFEMFVNRGIYHKGWTAVTRHSVPWLFGAKLPAYDDDEWELYAPTDWTQAHNIAAENPEMLKELQWLFLIEAVKYNVLPLDDRRIERLNSDLAGRPVLIKGKSQMLFSGMGRLTENVVLNLKNKSHAVTAEVVLPDGKANGVIIAQGGEFGGWTLYAKEGRLKYCYNLFGLQRFTTESSSPLPAGKHQVRMEFAYAGGGLAKGGKVTLYVDGQKTGEGQVGATEPMLFSADETCDVGNETGSTVTDDYTAETSKFNGAINWIQLDQGADDADHMITGEERLRVAMARQ